MPVAPHVEEYAGKVILATMPDSEYATEMVRRYVRIGSSPRGLQGLILGGKAQALLDNRFCVSCEDINLMAKPTLRHRIRLNLEGEAEEIATDAVIDDILRQIPQTVVQA